MEEAEVTEDTELILTQLLDTLKLHIVTMKLGDMDEQEKDMICNIYNRF